MSRYANDRMPSGQGPGSKFVRRVLPVIVLALVLLRLFAILADYSESRRAERSVESHETTGSVDATETSGGTEGSADEQAAEAGEEATPSESGTRYVVVVIPGLNFRAEPKPNAEVLRTLPEGTRLTLLGQQNGWYQVRDADGLTGWVSGDEEYVKVEPE